MILTIPSSRSRRRLAGASVLVLAALFCAALLRANIIPDAPVVNFRLPMFDEEGVRVWNLRGQEGRYIDENRVDVVDMELTTFSETEPGRVKSRIHSPEATMHIQRNQADGGGEITMEGGHYVMTGKNWHWDGNENRVSIDEEVRVLFFEDISDLFR